MSERIREIYLYTVCLITIIISIIAFTGLANTVAQIAFPYPPYAISSLETLRSADTYGVQLKDQTTLQKWVEEERQLQIKRDKAARQNKMAREVANNLALLVICLPLYIYHWRRIKAH